MPVPSCRCFLDGGWRGPDPKLSRQALVWAYGAPPPPTSPKSQPMPPPRKCFASLQKSSPCNQTQKTTRFSRSAGATKASALQTADQHVHRPRSHAASRSDSAKEGGPSRKFLIASLRSDGFALPHDAKGLTMAAETLVLQTAGRPTARCNFTNSCASRKCLNRISPSKCFQGMTRHRCMADLLWPLQTRPLNLRQLMPSHAASHSD